MSTNVPIASITLSAATSSVTFSGIPQTYTDLFLSMSLPAVSNGAPNNSDGLRFRLNGDAGSNYSSVYLTNNSSSATSAREISADRGRCGNVTQTSNDIGTVIVNFNNYTNTQINKTVLGRSGNSNSNNDANIVIAASLWRSTSAITSITFSFSSNGNFASGSTFSLYGINAANSAQAKATGGDSIYRDSSYWYHVFNSSGTFTPAQNLSNVDYLVVAGGGGGGSWYYGGGGGAGGLRSTVTATGGGGSLESKISLSGNNAYVITVGAGGIGSSLYASGGDGSDGSSSSIAGTGITTISSVGGGGGGGTGNNGRSGGSGGGSGGAGTAGSNNSFGTGGSGQNGQGYSGGSGFNVPGDGAGGGGGGAGAAGGNGVGGDGGNGGNGVTTSITGSSIIYGGGGGGSGYTGTIGTGGTGGGGSSTVSGSGNSGTTNLGGGGGGGAAVSANGGNGGSGIVIVRYPV